MKITSSKPLQDLIWITAMLLVVSIWFSGFNLFFLSPNELQKLSSKQVLVNITYPKNIFYQEPWVMDVTVTNQSLQKIDDLQIVLDYQGNLPIHVDAKETTKLDFSGLEPGELKTQRVSLIVASTGTGLIKSYLKIILRLNLYINSQVEASKDIPITLFPVEGIRTFSKFIASLLGLWVTWLGKQWWDLRLGKLQKTDKA